MKFSDRLFLDNETIKLEKKITKMSSSSLKNDPVEISKIQKQVTDTVVDNPEFDETVNSLASYAAEYGSDADKGQVVALINKIQSGVMEYNDVQELYSLSGRNYKYFFKDKPASFTLHSTACVGVIIALTAIVLRWFIDEDSNSIMMCAINICAIVFTLIAWPSAVRNNLFTWTELNGIPKIIGDKLITPVFKKTWLFVIVFFVLCILILVITSCVLGFAQGNDILSIISLSTAVLSDNIVVILVDIYKRRIYYNKER